MQGPRNQPRLGILAGEQGGPDGALNPLFIGDHLIREVFRGPVWTYQCCVRARGRGWSGEGGGVEALIITYHARKARYARYARGRKRSLSPSYSRHPLPFLVSRLRKRTIDRPPPCVSLPVLSNIYARDLPDLLEVGTFHGARL